MLLDILMLINQLLLMMKMKMLVLLLKKNLLLLKLLFNSIPLFINRKICILLYLLFYIKPLISIGLIILVLDFFEPFSFKNCIFCFKKRNKKPIQLLTTPSSANSPSKRLSPSIYHSHFNITFSIVQQSLPKPNTRS